MTMTVRFETTPNPQTLKFTVGQQLTQQPAEFKTARDAAHSPLAKKIFGFPWCDAVFVGSDFVTVTKQDWVDWDVLAEPLAGLIGEHLERGEAVVIEGASGTADGSAVSASDTPVVREIKKILNEEIRPAVALDGGDIVFHKYEGNVVYLYMQGACAGCPSSTFTLKEGIEARLRNAIPEIKEVVAL
ncbi:MAG: NifU family protein [Bdellovibrionaceae bacterium]|nr:NifU family protein [Pseudobdellovibrionaceae bacterium]